MRLRVLFASMLLALLSVSAFGSVHGAWTAALDDDGDIQFNVMTRPWNNWGETMNVSDFTGLSPDALRAPTPAPVNFELRRDAGTIRFEGTFKNGDGAGQLTFLPNPTYAASVRSLGFTIEPRGNRTEEDELFSLTFMNVSLDFIRTMSKTFPGVAFRDVERLAGVGVTTDWMSKMKSAGVEIETARDAIRLKGSGVTAKFVAELAAAGYKNLTVRELTRLAGAGVNSEFIREMSKYRSGDRQ